MNLRSTRTNRRSPKYSANVTVVHDVTGTDDKENFYRTINKSLSDPPPVPPVIQCVIDPRYTVETLSGSVSTTGAVINDKDVHDAKILGEEEDESDLGSAMKRLRTR